MAVTGYKRVGTDKYGQQVQANGYQYGGQQSGYGAQGGYGQGYGNNGQAAMQGVSENTKKQLEKYQQGYKPADSVAAAQQTLQQVQNQKPQGYNSKYSAPLENILQQIQNPEKFDYEFNGDNLFKAYADMYTQKGKQASLDVQGQAAAMTGGYGNSYAETAGAQAYQQYMTELYDKGLSMRDRAYQAYQDELANKREQYNILQQAENEEYGRYRDTYSDWQKEEEQAYNRAQAEREMDYKEYMDALNYYTGLMQIENQAWASEAERQEAIRQYEKSFAESQRQYDTSLAEQVRQYDTSLAESQRQYDTSFAEQQRQYDTSLAEQVRQYDTTLGEQQRQYDTSLAEQQRQYDTSFGEQVRQYDTSLEEQKRQYDASLEAQYYGYQNQKDIAEIGAAASRYSADQSLAGSLASAQASMYGSQLSAKSAADRLAWEKEAKAKDMEVAAEEKEYQRKLDAEDRQTKKEDKEYERKKAEEDKEWEKKMKEQEMGLKTKGEALDYVYKMIDEAETIPGDDVLEKAGMTRADAEARLASVQAKKAKEEADKEWEKGYKERQLDQSQQEQATQAAQAQCKAMVDAGHKPSPELLKAAGYSQEWADAMVAGKKDTYVPPKTVEEKPWYQQWLERLGLGGLL